jgi:hypothetical protein
MEIETGSVARMYLASSVNLGFFEEEKAEFGYASRNSPN